jgi:hypothetical protein
MTPAIFKCRQAMAIHGGADNVPVRGLSFAPEFGFQGGGNVNTLDIITDIDPSGLISVNHIFRGTYVQNAHTIILTSDAFSTGTGFFVLTDGFAANGFSASTTRSANTVRFRFSDVSGTDTQYTYLIQMVSEVDTEPAVLPSLRGY